MLCPVFMARATSNTNAEFLLIWSTGLSTINVKIFHTTKSKLLLVGSQERSTHWVVFSVRDILCCLKTSHSFNWGQYIVLSDLLTSASFNLERYYSTIRLQYMTNDLLETYLLEVGFEQCHYHSHHHRYLYCQHCYLIFVVILPCR